MIELDKIQKYDIRSMIHPSNDAPFLLNNNDHHNSFLQTQCLKIILIKYLTRLWIIVKFETLSKK